MTTMTKTAANEVINASKHKSATCVALASAYASAKNANAKKAIRAYVEAKTRVSSKRHWAKLLKAIDAGDTLRIKARSAVGTEARKAAWDAVHKAEAEQPKAATPAKPTAKAKAKAQAPAKDTGGLNEASMEAIRIAKEAGATPQVLAAMATALLD